jgi:hypothetical protein
MLSKFLKEILISATSTDALREIIRDCSEGEWRGNDQVIEISFFVIIVVPRCSS